jgi:hypothetical protein
MWSTHFILFVLATSMRASSVTALPHGDSRGLETVAYPRDAAIVPDTVLPVAEERIIEARDSYSPQYVTPICLVFKGGY